jgi:ceramide glucosyltransferase
MNLAVSHFGIALFGLVCLGVAVSYGLLTVIAVVTWRLRQPSPRSSACPPVTLLKPLCGAELSLYQHLRSFCCQDYSQYQIVFGVRDPADPALAVVRRLQAEFPALPIDVVINQQLHGSNYKIGNLINMLERARHEVLIVADSDTFVTPDYLASVTAPLNDPDVGLVTCVYEDVPTGRIWSRLGAMYINEWYIPSALLAAFFGHRNYASGQTLCMRRRTLEAIGGFAAMANHLADDYRLGELIRGLGLRIELSPTVVMAEHHESSLESLTRHELRWMRTIRALRPKSFRVMFLSFLLPMACCGLLLSSTDPAMSALAWWLFGAAASARLALYIAHRIRSRRPLFSELWLLPLRDLLLCWIWLQSFFTSRVTWRGGEFDVDADGIMHRPY